MGKKEYTKEELYELSKPMQPDSSKREDFYQKLVKEYLDKKEYWELDSSEKISLECFAIWLDRRCGALKTMET